MGWKDWSYTKRGTLIGSLIGLLLLVVRLFTFTIALPLDLLIIILGAIILQPVFNCNYGGFGYPGTCSSSAEMTLSLFVGVVNIIVLAILGALIGWIIGKFKQRKK